MDRNDVIAAKRIWTGEIWGVLHLEARHLLDYSQVALENKLLSALIAPSRGDILCVGYNRIRIDRARPSFRLLGD